MNTMMPGSPISKSPSGKSLWSGRLTPGSHCLSRSFTLAVALALIVTLPFALTGASARDASTAGVLKGDESAKQNDTKLKTYEQKTNTHRSLRSAANQMQKAAKKDRSQTVRATDPARTESAQAPSSGSVRGTSKKLSH